MFSIKATAFLYATLLGKALGLPTKAGKACQGQTLQLIMNIRQLRTLKGLQHWPLNVNFDRKVFFNLFHF
jgi:hypothetical protein